MNNLPDDSIIMRVGEDKLSGDKESFEIFSITRHDSR